MKNREGKEGWTDKERGGRGGGYRWGECKEEREEEKKRDQK